MRDFFINNGAMIASVIAVCEAILTILLFVDFAKSRCCCVRWSRSA